MTSVRTEFRATLLALAFASAMFAQAPAPDAPKPGRIEGTVVSTLGTPIPRATVRLSQTGSVGVRNPSAGYSTSMASGEDGHFVFEDVPSGRDYELRAERTGFLPDNYKATPNAYGTGIPVAAGATVRDLKITLTPQGVLTGQVVDERDEPVQFAQVIVNERQTPPSFSPNANYRATTDDRGMFRIPNLSPGAYIARAEPSDVQTQSASGVMTVPTFYPSITTLDGAAAIVVPAGVETPVTIKMRKEQVFAIRGKIVGLTPSQPQGPRAFLEMKVDSPQYGNRTIPDVGARDGTFVIPRALPGTYVLRMEGPQMRGMPNAGGYARAEVTVTDKDVVDVVLEYRLLPQIIGKVVAADGDIADVVGKKVRMANGGTPIPTMQFLPSGASSEDYIGVEVQPDGSFELRARPGTYGVRAGLLTTTYIRKVEINGTEVKGELEIPPVDGTVLTVTVSRHMAQLSVAVHDRDGKPVAGAVVWVRPKSLDNPLTDRGVLAMLTNQEGRVKIDGLRPGAYFISLPDPKHKEQNDSLWRRLTDPSTPVPSDRKEVTLAEDGQAEVELKADLP